VSDVNNINDHYAERNNTEKFGNPIKGSIATVIRSYKSAVTKKLHENGFIGRIWQQNYYEHIVRSFDNYSNITKYIKNNPFD
jgi:REP element-mobilizing transposase RayT